jgi:hypothetical protein
MPLAVTLERGDGVVLDVLRRDPDGAIRRAAADAGPPAADTPA